MTARVSSINSGTEDPTGVTNPNNSTNSQSENALGQTTQQSGAGIIASQYGYNADGQLTSLTTYPGGEAGNTDDEKAATTGWTYDPSTGLMASKHYADGTEDTYKYNSAGQLATVTEPGSGSGALDLTETFGYNAAGIQTSFVATDLGAADPNARLTASTINKLDDQGRAAIITDTDNGKTFSETDTYTALGQPQTETFGSAGNVAVANGYYPTTPGRHDPSPATESPDALASMTIQNLPNGQANAQTNYGYDPSSKRLQTITVNGITFTIGYVEGSTSQIGSITTTVAGQAGTAVTTTLSPYSGANGNASMLGGISVAAGGSSLYSATLGYNTNGQINADNVNSTDASGNSHTDNYVYTYGTGTGDNGEDANSLTQVTDNGTLNESYSYDGVGNIVDPALGDVNNLNQYAALSYNLRGDVTNDGTYAYTYDANDRMISVTPNDPDSGALRLTYGYDSQGRRTWKDVYSFDDANASWDFDYSRGYVYDGTQLVGELNTAGQLATGYTWSPSGQLLAVTDYTQTTPKTYVAVIDASGNTAMLVDPTNGTVAASYTYDSYGNLLTATGPAQAVCSFRGKGEFYDIEDPEMGHAGIRDDEFNHWMERDPAGEIVGGANLFAYLGGDPIDLSDTSGAAPESNQSALASQWQYTKYALSHPLTYAGIQLQVAYALHESDLPTLIDAAQMLHEAVTTNYTTVDNEWKLADQATSQGSANSINGLQDVGVSILNTPASVYNAAMRLAGSNSHATLIVSSDWSKGAVIPEGEDWHNASKFLGGNGIFVALTAGGGTMIAPASNTAKVLNWTNRGLNLANGTASGLEAITDFREGRNGQGTAQAGVSAVNFALFYLGMRGARPSARYVHNRYVRYVLGREAAQEIKVPTDWTDGNYGVRRFDGYSASTKTYFEGNTTPWREITWEKFNFKLGQAQTDGWLLANGRVPRVIWFGTEPLPEIGLGSVIAKTLKDAGIPYYVVQP